MCFMARSEPWAPLSTIVVSLNLSGYVLDLTESGGGQNEKSHIDMRMKILYSVMSVTTPGTRALYASVPRAEDQFPESFTHFSLR